MKNLLKSHLRLWLILGLMAAALLTLAFQGGDTDPAHCGHCQPPTPTPTYTPTSLPIQACQVAAVEFDKAEYITGEPIKVTLRISDSLGAPLIGANVDATVNRQPFTDTLEASAIPPLEDQSGTYDGVYTQTNLPGLYTFKFDVSDFTGPRFLPCSAEATVRVEDTPPPFLCTLDIGPTDKQNYELNEPVTLLANVTVNGENVSGVTVSAVVQRPDSPPADTLHFTGDGPYTGIYTKTDKVGGYNFIATAVKAGQAVECNPSRSIQVNQITPCQITPLQFDKLEYFLGDTMRMTTTVTNTSNITPAAMATVQKPNNDFEQVSLTCTSSGLCTGPYTPIMTGTHTFTATASDPHSNPTFDSCTSNSVPVLVNQSDPSTATVGIVPSYQTVDLCGRTNPDISNSVVATVTNLSQVDLTITYDPTFIIPSKITPVFGSGTVSRIGNTIRYQASSNVPVSGVIKLLDIDWRLQGRRGTTTITLTSTLRDNTGSLIPHTDQNGTLEIIISPPCLRCTTNLQGRADHSGVMVTSSSGEQTQSYPNGLFAIASTGELTLTAPGYLSAQMAASAGVAAGEPEANACQVNLLAGDLNGDNTVNILDLSRLAGAYQSTDPVADLNASGLVDILDLTLAAGNYQRQGQ